MQSTYITSAQKANQLPPETGLPEVAFLGRSNCGKSSLINILVGQKDLARTSSTPGRTQMANFFGVCVKAGVEVTLVDLPGYGFSQVPKAVSRSWDGLLKAYLSRNSIRSLFFLMDSRRRIEAEERQFLASLDHANHQVYVVMTKADKLNKRDLAKQKARLEEALTEEGIRVAGVFQTSSLTRQGVAKIQELIFV